MRRTPFASSAFTPDCSVAGSAIPNATSVGHFARRASAVFSTAAFHSGSPPWAMTSTPIESEGAAPVVAGTNAGSRASNRSVGSDIRLGIGDSLSHPLRRRRWDGGMARTATLGPNESHSDSARAGASMRISKVASTQ